MLPFLWDFGTWDTLQPTTITMGNITNAGCASNEEACVDIPRDSELFEDRGLRDTLPPRVARPGGCCGTREAMPTDTVTPLLLERLAALPRLNSRGHLSPKSRGRLSHGRVQHATSTRTQSGITPEERCQGRCSRGRSSDILTSGASARRSGPHDAQPASEPSG